MSDTDQTPAEPLEALFDRQLRILAEALFASTIPYLDDQTLLPPLKDGQISASWRIKDKDVELVLSSKFLKIGPFQCSIFLNGLVHELLPLAVYDEWQAVAALGAALDYLCAEISQALPRLQVHLLERSLNAVEKNELKQMDRWSPMGRKLFQATKNTLAQMSKLNERQRQQLEKKLRDKRDGRGGSGAKHDWTDEELNLLANKYEDYKPIWLEAKRIAKSAQNSRERSRRIGWREEVLRAYPYLPIELLNRLSSPRSEKAKPSDIAILHAKQETGVIPAYSTRELRKKIRMWKLNTKERQSSPSLKARKLKKPI